MPARRTRVAAALLALGVLGSGPLPTRAIDDTPPVALPSEPPAQSIPGPTREAVTADLGGDGVRELVRLTTAVDGSGSVSVEVWSMEAGRDAVLVLQESVRRDASVEEQLDGPLPDLNDTLPVLVNDAARLLVLRDGAMERVVLAAIGSPDDDARPCCLTLYEVRSVSGGALDLMRLGGIKQDADALMPLDLDGDGTDELVAVEGRDGNGDLPLRVYWPFGDSLETDVVSLEAITADARNASVGETDGRPGEDLVMTVTHLEDLQGPTSRLVRISLRDGDLAADTAPLSEPAVPFVVGRADVPTLVVTSPLGTTTETMHWPQGDQPQRTAVLQVAGRVVAEFGDVEPGMLFAPSDDPDRLFVVGLDLVVQTTIEGRVDARLLQPSPLVPYIGPWPGTDAQVFLGQRIANDGTVEPMASLLGSRPIGPVGRDGSTTALLSGPPAVPPDSRLAAGPSTGTLELVATEALLRPEAGSGRLEIGLRGAIFDRPGDTLVTPGPQFELLVDAPVGSRIATVAAPDVLDLSNGVTAAAGTTAVPVRLTGDALALTAVVVTPAGGAYHGRWQVEQRTSPPPLTLEAPVLPLSGSVRITGATDPGSTATVDGAAVPVDAAGRFESVVSAALAPTSHRVEVVDRVGNVATQQLSVVGWVDYRRLPWIPIISVLTLAAGILLWLRVPRPRAWNRKGSEDDAVLEEIDA